MTEGVGHNSDGRLRAFVERIERVEQDMRDRAEDRKEIYSEAKGTGLDVKILRRTIAIRKQDAKKRAEEEAILEAYLAELGMA